MRLKKVYKEDVRKERLDSVITGKSKNIKTKGKGK